MSKAITREQLLKEGATLLDADALDKILAQAKKAETLANHSESDVFSAIFSVVRRRTTDLKKLSEQFGLPLKKVSEDHPLLLSHIENELGVLKKTVPIAPILKPDPSFYVRQPRAPIAPLLINPVSDISNLTHEQKMNAGMAFLMAGFSALGTWSSARGMKTTDDQGTTHWSPTAVGFTLLQGALAAGMAYAGVFALRGAPVGRA